MSEYDTIDVYYGEIQVRGVSGTLVCWRDHIQSTRITDAASRLRSTLERIHQTTGGLLGD